MLAWCAAGCLKSGWVGSALKARICLPCYRQVVALATPVLSTSSGRSQTMQLSSPVVLENVAVADGRSDILLKLFNFFTSKKESSEA